jgi:serine/threonine protein kinase
MAISTGRSMSDASTESHADEITSSAEIPAQRGLVGQRLGRYEVLCELATGGMAAVYVARAVGLAGFERLVAIKVLHPHLAHDQEFISMFLDEARLAARIRHPNVVATQDVDDTAGDGFYLVMDYVAGDHLGSLLGKVAALRQALPPTLVARIMIDVLSGLAAAHDLVDECGEPLNIVHRDLSPHNILIGVEGVARLTDFGVAKAKARLSSTRAGQFKGKLSYVAPEQASNVACDQRSDLFVMGTVLWEALTSRRLFRGDTAVATLAKLVTDPIPPPSVVRPELAPWDALLARALTRDPAGRFQSAYDFAEAIEEVARGAGGVASAKSLSNVVGMMVGEKVEAERLRVKAAIDLSNGPEYVSQTRIPIPSSPTPGPIALTTSQSTLLARDSGAPPSSEFAVQTVIVRDVSPRTTVLLFGALVAVAVAAGFAGYYANRAQTGPQRVLVLPSTDTPGARSQPTMAEARPGGSTDGSGAPGVSADPASGVAGSSLEARDSNRPRAVSRAGGQPERAASARRRVQPPMVVEPNPYAY